VALDAKFTFPAVVEEVILAGGMWIVTTHAIEAGIITWIDDTLAKRMGYRVLLRMTPLAELYDICFEKRRGFGGMRIMTYFAFAIKYRFMNYCLLKHFSIICVTF